MDIKRVELKKYTSIRIGGECDIFTPKNEQVLQTFLQNNVKNIFFLGLGSNLLMSDNGFNGIIVSTRKLNEISVNNNIIIASCGTTLAKLSRFAIKNNQAGANFLSTIPGSVGGALTMNAGCFGHEIWQSVLSVKTIDEFGKIHNRKINDFKVSYRSVIAKHKNEYFLSCDLLFNNNGLSYKILQKRYDSQPIGTANFGSVFKNPPGHFAAQLIENAELKGFCIGSACVSNKHANFIINNNNANSKEIINLINYIKISIKNKFNIELESEVVIC